MYHSFDKLAVLVMGQPKNAGESWGGAWHHVWQLRDQPRPHLFVVVGESPAGSLLVQQRQAQPRVMPPVEKLQLPPDIRLRTMHIVHRIVQLESAGYRVEVWAFLGSDFERWLALTPTLHDLNDAGHTVRVFKAGHGGVEMRAKKRDWMLPRLSRMWLRQNEVKPTWRNRAKRKGAKRGKDTRRGNSNNRGQHKAQKRKRKNANRTGNGHTYPAAAAGRNTGS